MIHAIFFLLLGFGLWIYAMWKHPEATFVNVIAILFLSISFNIYKSIVNSTPEINPKAIDVYNNKTTLRITYQDSIPVDTVVVWKDEYKPKK